MQAKNHDDLHGGQYQISNVLNYEIWLPFFGQKLQGGCKLRMMMTF